VGDERGLEVPLAAGDALGIVDLAVAGDKRLVPDQPTGHLDPLSAPADR
jgi:hypothetical protein